MTTADYELTVGYFRGVALCAFALFVLRIVIRMGKIQISADEYKRLLLNEKAKGNIRTPVTNKRSMAVPKNKNLAYQHRANQAWRTIGGKKKYYRSSWEANYARYLQYLKEQGEIDSWEHEPEYFEFPIKHGVTRYLPDFKVVKNSKIHYEEVKGYFDKMSKTKIKRFRQFYPQFELIIIDSNWFKKNKNLSLIIKDWE